MLFLDEGGEEDSFVGQSAPSSQSSMGYFQPSSTSAPSNDPFAQVGHNPLPVSSSTPLFGGQPPVQNAPPNLQPQNDASPLPPKGNEMCQTVS